MNKQTVLKLSMVVVLSAVSMWAGFQLSSLLERSEQPPIIEGTVLNPPRALKPFKLIDQRRHDFLLSNFKNRWSLVFFGYTNCPDVCPNALGVLKQAYIDMDALKMDLPQVVFVSVDPQRDEPELLGDYVQYFDPSFVGVTGKKDQIDNLAKQLSAVYLKAAGASGDVNKSDYLFDHSAAILLINPRAEFQAVFTAPQNKLGIIDGLQKVIDYYNKSK